MSKTIIVDGIEYVPKEEKKKELAKKYEGMDYCIVRTHSAGVFAGYLSKREGKEGEVLAARRLWYWSGASSLSQLAVEGVKKPNECKFPCEVEKVILTEIIEIIPCTEDARLSIAGVPIWAQ